jgi:hypothetical protein
MYSTRMEKNRPELDAWFEKADEVLRDEEIVLEGLREAVRLGNMTDDELEENMAAYHQARVQENPNLICPDIMGRDI